MAVKSLITPGDVADEIVVVDSLGQRLILGIENQRGGGGQRRISVFSRYWMVNTTEHSLRYKQEKSNYFVSGNVFSPSRDGSRPIWSGRSYRSDGDHNEYVKSDESAIFSGTPGALATCNGTPEEVAALLERDLSLRRLSQLSYMFSFQGVNVMSMGQQRLSIKLSDGRGTSDDNNYESEWSRGFSLDSIGISQIVA
jgi:SHR-binding domain of vacuolar-sorting associated protein 13